MANKLTVNFTAANPAPSEGYLVRYWPTGNEGALQSTTVTTSPAEITGLAEYNYSGTIESICSFANSSRASFSAQLCNLQVTVETTNPTNQAGTNGTATVTAVNNGSGTYTYSWNTSPAQTTATATGLSSSISYTVTVTDTTTGCTASKSVTLGQTSFTFDADYMLITYQFTDGSDLDTRTRIVSINGTAYADQNAATKYIGYGQYARTPQTADNPSSGTTCTLTNKPKALWGGDNLGTGFESVLIDFTQFGPVDNAIIVDCRALWWGTIGSIPVNLSFTFFRGGCPVKQGSGGNPAYNFTNPTATATLSGNSASKVITAYRNDTNGTAVGSADLESPAVSANLSRGQRLAVITYDRSTGVGTIDLNNTSTPAV